MVINWQKKISTMPIFQQQNTLQSKMEEIKELVYINTSSQKSKRIHKINKSRNKQKYNKNSLFIEIQKAQLWKLIERIVIEALVLKGIWKTTTLQQDFKWIDVILKSWNIKIWTDITINTASNIKSIKKDLANNTAYQIDKQIQDNQTEYRFFNTNSISRDSDLSALLTLSFPELFYSEVINGFKDWQNNNFKWHWSEYTKFSDQIIWYLIDICEIIKEVMSKNIETWVFLNTLWFKNNFAYQTSYDFDNESFELMISDKQNRFHIANLRFYITNKYLKKIWITDYVISRKNIKTWQLVDFYENREFKLRNNHPDIKAYSRWFEYWENYFKLNSNQLQKLKPPKAELKSKWWKSKDEKKFI